MSDPAAGPETAAASAPREEMRPRWFSAVEATAVAFTIACVWLTAKGNILCWPVGIIGCVLYFYVFMVSRLYSDMLLQVYFFVTSVWGWYNWLHGGENSGELSVTRITPAPAAFWGAVIVAGSIALGTFMKKRTRAALPYLDATTTVMSLVAQYLLGCRILENWAIWIAADAIDTTVYFRRKLYMTSLLYVVLLVLAVMGLLEWMRA